MKAQRPVIHGTNRYCQVSLHISDLDYRDGDGFYRLREALHRTMEFDDALDVDGSPDDPLMIVTGRVPMNFGTEEALLLLIAGQFWEHCRRPATVSLDLTYFIETYQGKFTTEEEDWEDWKAHRPTL